MVPFRLSDRVKKEIWEWTQALVIAFIIAKLINIFLVQAFRIPSGSMRPTLMERDRIFVNKLIYRFKDPKRGDIVVFKYPEDEKTDFVKRLIALGGETVEIKDGDIYINGKLLEKPPIIKNIYYYNRGPYGEFDEKVKVPEGYYYVLGDNSESSKDSRYWGFVPKKNIIGRAFFIYWPIRRIRVLK